MSHSIPRPRRDSVVSRGAQRLSPGGAYDGDLSADIELMRSAAARVQAINPYVADARTEILKAVSVLRDGA